MPVPLVPAGVITAVGGGAVGVWIGRRSERSLDPSPANCGTSFYGHPYSRPDRLSIPKANANYLDRCTPGTTTSDLGDGVRIRPACEEDRGSLLPPIMPREQTVPGKLRRFLTGSAGRRSADYFGR